MEVPECPVCLDEMTAPVFQCQSGHSLCSQCSRALAPPKCPICRRDMTQMRNWMLEEILANSGHSLCSPCSLALTPAKCLICRRDMMRMRNWIIDNAVRARAEARAAPGAPAAPAAKRACPHKNSGCPYVFSAARDVEDHTRECIFRDMLCPHGAVFNDCFWIGKLKQLLEHFKQKHAGRWITFGSAVPSVGLVATGVNTTATRRLWLAAQGNMHFIITLKVDPDDNMAYIAIQHIGNKKNAQQWTYEIQVTSGHDSSRRVAFSDRCSNDVVPADDVFRQGKCASIPLRLLPLYVRDERLSFKFAVKKLSIENNMSNLQLS